MNGIAIVGGGISGLSAAYYLARANVPCTLIERRPRLGGVIRTDRVDGFLVEGGPDSFLASKPAALDLIRELGLESEVIGSNDRLRKTFIRRRGRMVPMPDGMQFLAPTRLAPILTTPLLGWGTKARMALEWFRKPRPAPAGDRSVAQFVADHYGPEAVEYLAEPLLAGVYGGTPEDLSVESVLPRLVGIEAKYGSLGRGILAERAAARSAGPPPPVFLTLKNGLGSLIDALGRAIAGKVRVIHGEAEAAEPCESGYRLRVQGEWMGFESLGLAGEAHSSAKLAASIDPALAEQLAGIRYQSSTVVALGFESASFPRPLEGFGFLVPRRERRRVVACTFMGTKFDFRVPPGRLLLRCFVSGVQKDDATLVALVLEELKDMLGLAGEPVFSRVYAWPEAMAQYNAGHRRRVEAIENRLGQRPRLHLAGNAFDGIGIPDCIRSGKRLAGSIIN